MPELDAMKRRLTWTLGARGGRAPDARPLDRTRVPRKLASPDQGHEDMERGVHMVLV